jgi:hypothetical protein
MNKEAFEKHTCGLDMEGGYHGHPYPQKFVIAPRSEHPSPAPSNGKECHPSEVMSMVMRAK